MYLGTTATAREIGVSPRTLRRWLQRRLVGEPRVISKNDVGGKRGTMLIRLFGPDEIEALKRFKTYYRASLRPRRKYPKLAPAEKKLRADRRKAILETEKMLHIADWFNRNGHSLRNHTTWEDAYAQLGQAGLLVGKVLAPGALGELEAKLATLKAEYAAAGGTRLWTAN